MSNYEPTCFECGYPEDKCICKSSEMLNQEVEGRCQSCLKERELYVSGLCKECSDKMDKHIEGGRE